MTVKSLVVSLIFSMKSFFEHQQNHCSNSSVYLNNGFLWFLTVNSASPTLADGIALTLHPMSSCSTNPTLPHQNSTLSLLRILQKSHSWIISMSLASWYTCLAMACYFALPPTCSNPVTALPSVSTFRRASGSNVVPWTMKKSIVALWSMLMIAGKDFLSVIQLLGSSRDLFYPVTHQNVLEFMVPILIWPLILWSHLTTRSSLVQLYNVVANTYLIDVYSSETDSWTWTKIILELPRLHLRRPGVFCNGAIHWRSHETALSYFDVGTGTLNRAPLAPMLFVDGHMLDILYFGECCGHLHVISGTSYLMFPLQFDVFEMASDYSGWSVRYHVDIRPTLSWHGRGNFGAFSVLSVIQAEEESESMIVLFLAGGVAVSYNPCDGTSNKLSDLESRPKHRYYSADYYAFHTYQYFESLVSLWGNQPCQ